MPGAFGPGHFCALFIERWVHEVHIFFIQLVAGKTKSLTEALEVNNFPGPQKADGIVDVRVVRESQNVVIGHAGFLLCCDRVRTTFLFCS